MKKEKNWKKKIFKRGDFRPKSVAKKGAYPHFAKYYYTLWYVTLYNVPYFVKFFQLTFINTMVCYFYFYLHLTH